MCGCSTNNHTACQRSRSRGVGARIIRRCKSFTSNSHRSSDRSISLTPIIPPSQHDYLSRLLLSTLP